MENQTVQQTNDYAGGFPGTYLTDDNVDTVTTPGLYVMPEGELLFVRYFGGSESNIAQTRIDYNGSIYYRDKRPTHTGWSSWYSVAAPNSSISGDMLRDGTVPASKLADAYPVVEYPDPTVDFDTLVTPGFYAIAATAYTPGAQRYQNGPTVPHVPDGNYDESLCVWVLPAGYGTHGVNQEVYYNGLMQIAVSLSNRMRWFRYQQVPYNQPQGPASWTAWTLMEEPLPAASTQSAGVVKLNNTLTSTSTTEALTAAQGKELNDRMFPLYERYNFNIDQVNETCIRVVGGATAGTKPPCQLYALVFSYYPRNGSGYTDGNYMVQTAIGDNGVVSTRYNYSNPPAWSNWVSSGN